MSEGMKAKLEIQHPRQDTGSFLGLDNLFLIVADNTTITDTDGFQSISVCGIKALMARVDESVGLWLVQDPELYNRSLQV